MGLWPLVWACRQALGYAPESTSELLSQPCKRLSFKSKRKNLSLKRYTKVAKHSNLTKESINLANLEEMKQKLNPITLDDGLLWSSDDSVHY